MVTTLGNLTDDVLDRVARNRDSVAFARREGDAWIDVTITEFRDEVMSIAKGLIGAGIGAGDRVALLSKTRYEWTLFDYAIWWVGAVTVPIYETSSVGQITWILQDSSAVACIVESTEHAGRVAEARGSAAAPATVWTIDVDAVASVIALGAGVSDEALEARRAQITSDSIATLIYTSGTTGRPKGCVLTHGNFRFELGGAIEILPELFDAEGASTLLFLPLAHVVARIIQVGAIRSDTKLGHTADVADLVTHLGEFHPSFILAVPRVFEKVFNAASQRAYADGKGKIFDAAVATAIAHSKGIDSGRTSIAVKLKHGLFDKLVYSKLRTTLGGRAAYAHSGGAP
ncbi:MAG: long-chain fatty acid--CoA ligase [Nocardioidaceae bacterium]|nr:long-chain fatty acid--CoA ligase [Nocardioidaceae bacterium]